MCSINNGGKLFTVVDFVEPLPIISLIGFHFKNKTAQSNLLHHEILLNVLYVRV